MLPDPFDVVEATLGPHARVVDLEGGDARAAVRVVRTASRVDHPPGNAVHHHLRPPPSLAWAVDDLDERFPTGRARLLLPTALANGLEVPEGLVRSDLVVTRRAGPAATSTADGVDVRLLPPADDRDWHGITVLQRHAVAPGEDRSRGRHDGRVRWWVDGLRQLVGTGRARVLRAVRFGTPVGAGVLHWAPGTRVDDDHAGLAVVADVVVHPAHRGLGVAAALRDELVRRHLSDFPRACVATLVECEPGGGPAAPAPGWTAHATLLALTRAAAPGGT